MPPNDTQRNIVETAIEAGRRQVAEAHDSPLDDGKPYIILRNGDGSERIEFIEARFESPHRKGGTVKLSDEESFKNYWIRHAIVGQSTVYGCIAPAKFVAVFNDHGAEPDFRDHRALYELKHSKEWQEWTHRSSQKFDGTVAFAEWLENHIPDMVEPEGAKMLEIALNLRVTANAAYSKAVRLNDGNTEFTYTNQVEGASHANGGSVRIPEQFTIAVPVFEGINVTTYRVDARFRYRLSGSTLSLWYELVRPHKVVEEAFADILGRIQTETGTTVLFGSPE